jgi:hypothetical protein
MKNVPVFVPAVSVASAWESCCSLLRVPDVLAVEHRADDDRRAHGEHQEGELPRDEEEDGDASDRLSTEAEEHRDVGGHRVLQYCTIR